VMRAVSDILPASVACGTAKRGQLVAGFDLLTASPVGVVERAPGVSSSVALSVTSPVPSASTLLATSVPPLIRVPPV
ncbi:hypothetical protein AGQ50_24865, partial [Salmonella enterica subsp. enterica]